MRIYESYSRPEREHYCVYVYACSMYSKNVIIASEVLFQFCYTLCLLHSLDLEPYLHLSTLCFRVFFGACVSVVQLELSYLCFTCTWRSCTHTHTHLHSTRIAYARAKLNRQASNVFARVGVVVYMYTSLYYIVVRAVRAYIYLVSMYVLCGYAVSESGNIIYST